MLTFVTFHAGGAVFGVEIRLVSEVLPDEPPTPLPGGPPFVEGLRVLRGKVLPIMDLSRRLGLEPALGRATARVLWIDLPRGPVGFRVERVGKLVRCEEEHVLPTEGTVSGIAAAFLKGVIRREEGLLLWLDPERVLTAAEQEAVASAVHP